MICTFLWYNDREVFCMGVHIMTTRKEAIDCREL